MKRCYRFSHKRHKMRLEWNIRDDSSSHSDEGYALWCNSPMWLHVSWFSKYRMHVEKHAPSKPALFWRQITAGRLAWTEVPLIKLYHFTVDMHYKSFLAHHTQGFYGGTVCWVCWKCVPFSHRPWQLLLSLIWRWLLRTNELSNSMIALIMMWNLTLTELNSCSCLFCYLEFIKATSPKPSAPAVALLGDWLF